MRHGGLRFAPGAVSVENWQLHFCLLFWLNGDRMLGNFDFLFLEKL